VLARLERPERVEFFEIPAVPVSAQDLRGRVARGEPIDGLVPEAVAREIEARGLYR
jgi:nicotinic acid mononucleotide adenylyltransferase